MRILGFYHIFLIGHWYTVVTEQLRILLTSGLYDACEEINIGCLGTPVEKSFLEKYIVEPHPKLKIRYYSERAEDYEFPTLKLIEADDSHYVGFYFHAKGVTKPAETVVNHWRAYLNETVINRWQEHRDRVENGYDVSSVNFLKSPDHFSGNFWWFHRSYIDRLPPISTLNHSYRWHAEQWIAMGKPNFYTPPFIEPGDAVFPLKYK